MPQAVALINRRHDHGLTALTGNEVVIDADQPEIPVGIDGETVLMPTPVRCTVRPGALRVLVPRDRPAFAHPGPPLIRPGSGSWLPSAPFPSQHG